VAGSVRLVLLPFVLVAPGVLLAGMAWGRGYFPVEMGVGILSASGRVPCKATSWPGPAQDSQCASPWEGALLCWGVCV